MFGKFKRYTRVLVRDLVVNAVAASTALPSPLRYLIYRSYGIATETSRISPGCFFGGSNIKIGKGSSVNYRCFFDNLGPIEIGENCNLAMEVMLCTSTHRLGPATKRAGDPIGMLIKIGDGCWIGARALILPGVTVGDGCVIAAGAVVTGPCEPNGVYAGVPARRIRDLCTPQVDVLTADSQGHDAS